MTTDMNLQATVLQRVLTTRDLTHLRVVKRGQTLTITNESHPEVRLSLIAQGEWRLDFRHHSNRWQPTPFVGDIAEMVDLAVSMGRLQRY